MLILTRKVNENIMIGDDICIRVVGVSNKNVLLGIRAPKEISVHRQEIYDRINLQMEKQIAQNDKIICLPLAEK